MKWGEMSPRERDVLVAEKVMGWTYLVPRYTTDISVAWEVVEKWRLYEVHKVGDWYTVWFYGIHPNTSDYAEASAPTASEAICKAALKAVGVDIE